MESLINYEEAYEIYKKERKTAEDRYMKWLLIWLACLPLAIVIGVGIYEGMVEYPGDDAAAFLAACSLWCFLCSCCAGCR